MRDSTNTKTIYSNNVEPNGEYEIKNIGKHSHTN